MIYLSVFSFQLSLHASLVFISNQSGMIFKKESFSHDFTRNQLNFNSGPFFFLTLIGLYPHQDQDLS